MGGVRVVVLAPPRLVHEELHQLGQRNVVDGDEGCRDGCLALGQEVNDARHDAHDRGTNHGSPDELVQPPEIGWVVPMKVGAGPKLTANASHLIGSLQKGTRGLTSRKFGREDFQLARSSETALSGNSVFICLEWYLGESREPTA